MALKLFVFAAILGLSSAGVIPSPLRVASPVAVDADPHPAYTYAYDVQDALTGDSKRQHESRSGDVVRGSYSLNDPDGTRRTVDYAADPVNGFNAVVRREPQAVKAVALVAHPTVARASSGRLDAPSRITVAALPGIVSAGAPFVQQLPQQMLQPVQQVQRVQQQLQQLVNPVALATNLGLAVLPAPAVLQAGHWA